VTTRASGTSADDARADVDELLQKLGVGIDPELLLLALTHRSYAYEHGGIAHNERLEFLGDSVLGQAVTVMLFRRFPDLDEGDLAKRRASVVSTIALAEIARTIELGVHIRLGKGEEQTGGRDKNSILADCVEAVIGATYIDAGADAATDLVLRLVEPLVADADRFGAAMDPKTSLQELAARQGRGLPVYAIVESGPDHDKRFHATVSIAEQPVGRGIGTSKKHAEMAAALEAWTTLSARTKRR
jgi:ribonuclease III